MGHVLTIMDAPAGGAALPFASGGLPAVVAATCVLGLPPRLLLWHVPQLQPAPLQLQHEPVQPFAPVLPLSCREAFTVVDFLPSSAEAGGAEKVIVDLHSPCITTWLLYQVTLPHQGSTRTIPAIPEREDMHTAPSLGMIHRVAIGSLAHLWRALTSASSARRAASARSCAALASRCSASARLSASARSFSSASRAAHSAAVAWCAALSFSEASRAAC